MYRGSRLAASFLLVLTGLAASAVAIFVVPSAFGDSGARLLIQATRRMTLPAGTTGVQPGQTTTARGIRGRS
jgi:hypothetical protein